MVDSKRREMILGWPAKAALASAVSPLLQLLPEPVAGVSDLPVPAGMAANTIIGMRLAENAFSSDTHQLNQIDIECSPGIIRSFKPFYRETDATIGSNGKIAIFREIMPEIGDVSYFLENAPIRIVCPGWFGIDADNQVLHDLVSGRPSTQSDFIDRVIPVAVEMVKSLNAPSMDFEVFGHSLGCPEALEASYLLKNTPGIRSVKTTLFEPLDAAGQASDILRKFIAQTSDTGRTATPEELERFVNQLARDVSTIRVYPYTAATQMELGNKVRNQPFGDRYYTIDESWSGAPDFAAKERAVFRDATFIAAPIAGVKFLSFLFNKLTGKEDSQEPEAATGQKSKSIPRRIVNASIAASLVGTITNMDTYIEGQIAAATDMSRHSIGSNPLILLKAGDAGLTSRTPSRPSVAELASPDNYPSNVIEQAKTSFIRDNVFPSVSKSPQR